MPKSEGDDWHRAQRLEALGKLTGGVAHDFNNLLTVILGAAETLLDDHGHDVAVGGLASLIRQAAERGSALTGQLLAFARRQPLAPTALDADALIAGMEPIVRRALGEDLDIVIARSRAPWPVLADSVQLETAILNVVINARHAMPHGGKLTIETANVTLDEGYADRNFEVIVGDYVMIAITDTGVGMNADVANHAFEPFFTTRPAGEGTGLGLSMVYGFARQTRGHAKIYSELGVGTTVKLYVPRAPGELPERAATAEEAPPGGTEHVLVVEDDPLVSDNVARQLASLGYRVTLAGDGPEALDLLESIIGDIDLLFTDVVMPRGMTGRQLADRARLARPDLRVLYTSGYTENAIVHHGQLDAGVHFIAKPYRKRELARAVRAALDETVTIA